MPPMLTCPATVPFPDPLLLPDIDTIGMDMDCPDAVVDTGVGGQALSRGQPKQQKI